MKHYSYFNRALMALLGTSAMTTLAQDRPNIIMFIVDDMGLMDTSVPFDVDSLGEPIRQPLNDLYRTPSMERLAEQGTRFTTFYAMTVSSPSRCSLLTGQNSARHHVTNWIRSEEKNTDEYGPEAWRWEGLSRADSLYPDLLREAGYHTIHIGKAHLAPIGYEGEWPQALGFDVNIAGSSIGEPGSYSGENGYGLYGGTRSRAVPDLEKYHHTSTHLTEALTLEAIEQIEEAVKLGRPFYLNMSHYAVHNPFERDPRYETNYTAIADSLGLSPQAVGYATLIEGMDSSLGQIMDALEALGIAEQTLICFVGDNGGDAPLGGGADWASSAPYRGKKGAEFEGGSRVPMIMAWARPSTEAAVQQRLPIRQGAVQTQLATIMDFYPTLLEVAGVEMPAGKVIDGESLATLLAQPSDAERRREVLLHFPHEHRGSYFTAYRQGDWKIIYRYHPEVSGLPEVSLYDLRTDPYEHHDLAAERPEMVEQLLPELRSRLAEQGAQLPR
ncbi:MAG: sulfatase [Bacteroidales bacterium]|nr:sulfatase [Bacteroidales bacterium]